MRTLAVRARRTRSSFRVRARKAAQSHWMSVAAAAAVILATAGTWVSGSIASSTQTCDLQRELMLANGSAELSAGKGAMLKMTEARTYMTLAMGTMNVDQRREYAYLGL